MYRGAVEVDSIVVASQCGVAITNALPTATHHREGTQETSKQRQDRYTTFHVPCCAANAPENNTDAGSSQRDWRVDVNEAIVTCS
jgi:hypothetical protein